MMKLDLALPYITGGELAFSILSLVVALLAVMVNYNYMTYRVMRLFLIATYFMSYVVIMLSKAILHVYYHHQHTEINKLLLNQLIDHHYVPEYSILNCFMMVGVTLSFIFYKRDQ